VQHIKKQPNTNYIEVWVDTDFAGCKRTRKSTSGGMIMIGGHMIKCWSKTQNIIALSSGEAEYYGMVQGASIAMGIRSMLADMGVHMKIRLRTDATAAKGIASRRGLGKIRHIEVHQLWLQEKVNNQDIEVMKVKGEVNLADALTKYLDGPGTKKHMDLTEQVLTAGRHNLTPDFEAADQGYEDVEDHDVSSIKCVPPALALYSLKPSSVIKGSAGHTAMPQNPYTTIGTNQSFLDAIGVLPADPLGPAVTPGGLDDLLGATNTPGSSASADTNLLTVTQPIPQAWLGDQGFQVPERNPLAMPESWTKNYKAIVLEGAPAVEGEDPRWRHKNIQVVERDNNHKISEYDWGLQVIKILKINANHQQQVKHANMSEELLAQFKLEESELSETYAAMHVGISKAKAGREAFSRNLSEQYWAGVPERDIIGPEIQWRAINHQMEEAATLDLDDLKLLLNSKGYNTIEKTGDETYVSLRPLPELEGAVNIPLTGKLAEEVAATDRKALERIRTSYIDLLDRTQQMCYRELVHSGVSVETAQNITEFGAQRQMYMSRVLVENQSEPHVETSVTGKEVDMFIAGIHESQLAEINPITGHFNSLARAVDYQAIENRIADKHRQRTDEDLRDQLEKYRLYTTADKGATIRAQRTYFLNADLERAQDEERTIKNLVGLSRIGTMRTKDRVSMIDTIQKLAKNTFPLPSQQMDINWGLGYVHFGISESLWTTMCTNWFLNATQGWKKDSKYTHDPIQGLDILDLKHKPAISPNPWSWMGMGRVEYYEWRRVLEAREPKVRLNGSDLYKILAPEVFLNTPDLLKHASVPALDAVTPVGHVVDIVELAIYFGTHEAGTMGEGPRAVGGTGSRSSGIEQTPPAAKRVKTKPSVSFADETNEGTAQDSNMGIAISKGLSVEERAKARALPEFTAKSIADRTYTTRDGDQPRVPNYRHVPMKAPPAGQGLNMPPSVHHPKAPPPHLDQLRRPVPVPVKLPPPVPAKPKPPAGPAPGPPRPRPPAGPVPDNLRLDGTYELPAVDLSGGDRNSAQAWVDAVNMGIGPTHPGFLHVAPAAAKAVPKPRPTVPRLNRVASQPGLAMGSMLDELGGGAGTPRANEMPRTNSVAALIRKKFPTVGVLSHRNEVGEHLCVGPGTVPKKRNGMSTAEHEWEFYVQGKHPEPTFRITESGARILRWTSNTAPTPVSNTTGHFFSTDHRIAPIDLYQLINKVASELAVEVTGIYYDRHTGSTRDLELHKQRYEPTGHTLFAIAPGNNAKLLLMIELLDKLTYPVSYSDQYNAVTKKYEPVSTSVTGCQLSTQELTPFSPQDIQYTDRDPLTGPRYYSETRLSSMCTEMDHYGWFGRKAHYSQDQELPAVENYIQAISAGWNRQKSALQDLFGNELAFGNLRPMTVMGSTYQWLGGKSFRALTFGHAERKCDTDHDQHMQDASEHLSKNLQLLTYEVGHTTTVRGTHGSQVPGPYSMEETTVLRKLMKKMFDCDYDVLGVQPHRDVW